MSVARRMSGTSSGLTASAFSIISSNSWRFCAGCDTLAAMATNAEADLPFDSSTARSKCLRARAASPPMFGDMPSRVIMTSWMAPSA